MNKNGAWNTLNKILTAAALIMLLIWAWKFFSPDSIHTRAHTSAAAHGAFSDMSGLLSISVAVVCGGYLLWRFLSWLFWHKYFKDERFKDEK